MGAEPGIHLAEEHEPHPPAYLRLLGTFRVLLPTSYLVLTALAPYLPTALGRLGVQQEWRPVLGATWTAGRLLTFGLMERWHGWHGRWWPAVVAVALLLGGFAAAVLSPLLGPGPAGLAAMLGGLAAFGLGMAAIYTGSLYYAMECERDDVEAGSRHETLIGVGYSGGPACGLVAGMTVQAGLIQSGSREVLVLGLVGAIALGVVSAAGWRVVRRNGP